MSFSRITQWQRCNAANRRIVEQPSRTTNVYAHLSQLVSCGVFNAGKTEARLPRAEDTNFLVKLLVDHYVMQAGWSLLGPTALNSNAVNI